MDWSSEPRALVACRLNTKGPDADVGVPVMFVAFTVMPGGVVPLVTEKVAGLVAVNVYVVAVPTVPEGLGFVILGAAPTRIVPVYRWPKTFLPLRVSRP